ncbi:MAG: hypothetical protein ABIP58_04600 [Dehalococcoidia bacterium]
MFATVEEAQGFVNAVWDKHAPMHLRTRPPVVHGDLRSTRTVALGGHRRIRVQPDYLTRWVLCHEMAHGLIGHTFAGSPGHDPYFVRVLIELLGRYGAYDANHLIQTAEEAGIRIAPLEAPGYRYYVRLYVRERRRSEATASSLNCRDPPTRRQLTNGKVASIPLYSSPTSTRL